MTSEAAGRTAEVVASVFAPAIGDDHLRAQAYALAGVIRNLDIDPNACQPGARGDVAAAVAAGDEEAAVRAARKIAQARRSRISPIDWTRASMG